MAFIINTRVRGTRSLLMNDSFGEEAKGRKKTVYNDLEEATKRLIKNTEGVICQKASHFEGCMTKSAADYKFKGKKTFKDAVKSGVIVTPVLIPHLNQVWAIDKQSVVISRARIMRARPRLDNWELSFKITIDDDRLEPEVLKDILENAGKYVGVGDFRPKFGLFEIVEWAVE
jgi:hypothetical protein